ncbi:MAG: HupE/UreJ family protein, partial [Nannocystaceae bacterium]
PRIRRDQPVVAPVFPDTCDTTDQRLTCGAEGLQGSVTFTGLVGSNVEVVITLEHLDGSIQTQVLSADEPSFDPITEEVQHASTARALATQYFMLGLAHILEGFDHLMFVTGLILIVGYRRRLFWTITAFTAAHSITLAASILDLVHLAPAPVEFVIALSIVLVAREALDDHPSLTRRFPWAVAFVFGLIHGFGFSGALAEIGIPADQVAIPLLTFNLGVEAGQLLVVALLGVLSIPAARATTRLPWLRTAFIYAMGSTAAYWSIERLFALLRGA